MTKISKFFSNLHAMHIGKKVYAILWLFTGALLSALIVLFVVKKDDIHARVAKDSYDLKDVSHNVDGKSLIGKVEADDKAVTGQVTKGGTTADLKVLYTGPTGTASKSGLGFISEHAGLKSDTKMVTNNFYQISNVAYVQNFTQFFNLDVFQVNGVIYHISEDKDFDAFLAKTKEANQKHKPVIISPTWMTSVTHKHISERVLDLDVDGYNKRDLTSVATKAQNTIAGLGVAFLVSMTGAIISTTIVSKVLKDNKKAKKGGKK